MKCLIVDSTSFQRKKTGIETYGFEISREIYLLASSHKMSVLFLFHKNIPDWFKETDSIKAKIYRGNSKLLMEQFWIPWAIWCSKPDKLFFPVFPPGAFIVILKFMLNLKVFRTIFDTIMWKFPETTSRKNKLYMKPLETFGTTYYDHVFTISESSREDIIGLFPKLKDKITNASIALKTVKVQSVENAQTLDKFHLEHNKYILFVGTIEPRKNVEFTLSILQKLHAYDPDIKLVLAGRVGWGHKQLVQNTLYSILADRIVFTDYVSDEEMNSLYSNAIAFVFPSLYEGFGLPIIEAMEQGTPVIASNNSSIPEAVGGAGVLVSGYDAAVWANEIIRLYEDENLKNTLIQKGFDRIKLLSWNKTAQIIMKEIANED